MLISQSTWVSSPAASFAPYMKSASQMTGSSAGSIDSTRHISGSHSHSSRFFRFWKSGRVYANTRHGCTLVDRFDLPDADATVAAVLLQHARLAFGEALRQLAAELLQRRIETCVGAPAHVARPIEHFLRAHLQNHVRMRAHEHTTAGHVTQNRIELRAVAVLADRIDPDEHTVDPQ